MEYICWPAWLAVWLCSLLPPAHLLISWIWETGRSPWFHSNYWKHQCYQHSSPTKCKAQQLLGGTSTPSQPKPGHTVRRLYEQTARLIAKQNQAYRNVYSVCESGCILYRTGKFEILPFVWHITRTWNAAVVSSWLEHENKTKVRCMCSCKCVCLCKASIFARKFVGDDYAHPDTCICRHQSWDSWKFWKFSAWGVNTRMTSGCFYAFLNPVRVVRMGPCKEPLGVLPPLVGVSILKRALQVWEHS